MSPNSILPHLFLLPLLASAQFKIQLISEPDQQEVVASFTAAIAAVQSANPGLTIDVDNLNIERESDETQLNATCDRMAADADYSAVVDLSWGGWMALKDQAEAAGFPYVRVEAANHQFVRVKILIFIIEDVFLFEK